MSDQMFCRFCGKGMPADSQFCPHCGQSQGKPAGSAVPPKELPAEQGQLSPMASTSEKKGNKVPIVFMVIAGLVGICCIGLVISQVFMKNLFGGTAPEIVVAEMTALSQSGTAIVLEQTLQPMQTASAEQVALARKWTVPFLALFTAEQYSQELIDSFQSVQDGTVTRDELVDRFSLPDAYFEAGIVFFIADDPLAELSGETLLEVDPTVKPFLAGLHDDYTKLEEIKINWWDEKIDPIEAIWKVQEVQAALVIERERMLQAAKMDGVTDEVYALVQTAVEDQWPEFKASLTDLAIKRLTPQP